MTHPIAAVPTTRRRHVRLLHRPAGFTLVELLVVVVIIIILAGLLVPAVMFALERARVAKMSVEVSNLAKAIEAYKIEYGQYPPDLSGNDASDKGEIDAHLGRIFRYRDETADAPPSNLDPGEALYFWLRGFSPDPEKPLTGPGDRTALYDFDQTRLAFYDDDYDTDTDGTKFEYVPAASANKSPYVYFNNATYGTASYSSTSGTAKPYKSDSPAVTYSEENKFQIIAAGADEDYGANSTDKSYPSGLNYNDADFDNVTSFNDKGTLGDAIQ